MIPARFSFSSRYGHGRAEYNYVDYSHRNRETGRKRSPATAAAPVNHARKGYGPSLDGVLLFFREEGRPV